LIVLSFIDYEKGIIPRSITIIGFICGILIGYFGKIRPILDIMIGGILGGLIFVIIGYIGNFIFKRESIGGGDVFLAMLIGFFLGYKNVFISIWFGFLITFIFILGHILKTKRITGRIRFGPFLSLGALLCVFYGEQIVQWYFRIL